MKTRSLGALLFFLLLFSLLACQNHPSSVPPFIENTPLREDDNPTSSPTETTLSTVTDIPHPTPTVTVTDPPKTGLPVFSTPEMFTFSFFTPARGWAVTRDQKHLLATEDGGQTWLDAMPPELNTLSEGYTSYGLRPFFLDENITWFTPTTAGNAILYHTRDGGYTWETSLLPFENARFEFLDLNVGYALVDLGAGAGSHYVAIYQTLDGGETWKMVFTHEPGETKSLPNGGSKNGITFRGVDHGWMGGAIPMEAYFYLFYTEDGGVTWAQETDILLPEDFAGSMLDVWQPIFVDAASAFLPIRAYPPGGGIDLLLYRSDDYGETWSYRGFVESGEAVDFISVDEGWLAAGEDLFMTMDGGVTWSASSGKGIPTGEVFLNVDFVDQQYGWVLTTPDSSTWEPLKLYRTMDGGVNWLLLLP